ncbi:hypothetical protein KI387_001454, partial [Taxus chinensis]
IPLGLSSGEEWNGPGTDALEKEGVSSLVRSCGPGMAVKFLVLQLGFSEVKNLIKEMYLGKVPLSSQPARKEIPSTVGGLKVCGLRPLEEFK